MVAAQQTPPEGRYGRSADARADRTLRTVGLVLGVLALALVGWFGFSYVSGADVSGELIKFKVVSDDSVEAHLEIRKDSDVRGVCTLRAMDKEDGEVGRKDVRVDGDESRVDTVVTMRTTGLAASVELVNCESVREN
ncbi:DUF4307 domain-containing protein [Streptomyces sp. Z26]|uniref:DUF4307 domain-containing protein n=1 Tax=Streptomyces sp. Z26 TaxID=2500177 RepID=UPI000EF14380|nr:DUF4307 domain-containing protein [Streptomyces sp. Z26]RLL68613.1 DUF4307 domain-containing protein [Streptomyces sp. Z26]